MQSARWLWSVWHPRNISALRLKPTFGNRFSFRRLKLTGKRTPARTVRQSGREPRCTLFSARSICSMNAKIRVRTVHWHAYTRGADYWTDRDVKIHRVIIPAFPSARDPFRSRDEERQSASKSSARHEPKQGRTRSVATRPPSPTFRYRSVTLITRTRCHLAMSR